MFWNLKFVLFVILCATIHIISLVDGLKCLQCISDKCRKGDKKDPPKSITCNPNDYCSKTLYQKYGKNDVLRGCYSKQALQKTNLRLNECGEHDDGSGNHEICICDTSDNCNSGPDFPPPPKGLKCLECTSDDCLYGIVKPTTISCQKGYYCEKYSYIGKKNTKLIQRDCQKPEYLLSLKSKLNDCGLYIVNPRRKQRPTCYCNKDGCNSGDNFEPKPNSNSPPIDCQQCDDNTPTKCSNEEHDIDKCESGYICYKLFEVDSNVSRVVKRGCIHKEFSSDLGLNINECGQFTNSSNEKQPICICDKDNCNAGGWLKTENQTEEKESPCPNSVPIYFNQFFVIFTILIGLFQIIKQHYFLPSYLK